MENKAGLEKLKYVGKLKTQLTDQHFERSEDEGTSEHEGPIFEEFEPSSKWNHDDASDIPEFKEEQVEVQIITSYHSNIAAKFEYGILSIRFPKLIINNNNNQQQNVPTQEPQKPQQPIIPHQPNTTEISDQKKQQEPKKDEEEKPKQNGKAKELTKDDDDDVKNKVEKRSETTRQRYVNASCGLVDEIKKHKKFVSLLLLVLMFGLYVKSVIKSLFSGGHKSQEL